MNYVVDATRTRLVLAKAFLMLLEGKSVGKQFRVILLQRRAGILHQIISREPAKAIEYLTELSEPTRLEIESIGALNQ